MSALHPPLHACRAPHHRARRAAYAPTVGPWFAIVNQFVIPPMVFAAFLLFHRRNTHTSHVADRLSVDTSAGSKNVISVSLPDGWDGLLGLLRPRDWCFRCGPAPSLRLERGRLALRSTVAANPQQGLKPPWAVQHSQHILASDVPTTLRHPEPCVGRNLTFSRVVVVGSRLGGWEAGRLGGCSKAGTRDKDCSLQPRVSEQKTPKIHGSNRAQRRFGFGRRHNSSARRVGRVLTHDC